MAGHVLRDGEFSLWGSPASAEAGVLAAEDNGVVVLLDTNLTPDLLAEGDVRELAHAAAEARRHAGLELGSPAALCVSVADEAAAAMSPHLEALAEVAVGGPVVFGPQPHGRSTVSVALSSGPALLSVAPAG